jgi:RNA polymerase sigma factor (sigma-70 family)
MPDGNGIDKAAELTAFLAGEPGTLALARRVIELVAVTHGIPASDREDIVQTTLMQALEKAREPGFQLEIGLKAFLRKVAHCRCVDWRRERKRRRTEPIPPDIHSHRPGPDDVFLRNERLRRATKAMESLSPSCRRLIKLVIQDNLTYAQVAEMTSKDEGALRVQMCHCLKKLRGLLQPPPWKAPWRRRLREDRP